VFSELFFFIKIILILHCDYNAFGKTYIILIENILVIWSNNVYKTKNIINCIRNKKRKHNANNLTCKKCGNNYY